MEKFYCNGKKGICTAETCNEECEFYDNTGGKVIKETTNGDRIRAMSDEELAECLYYGFDVEYCSNAPECAEMLDTDEGIPEARCKGCVLAWLQQPAENEKEVVE